MAALIRLSVALLMPLVGVIVGCGPSPTVPASGRLTYKGEPVGGVSVQFVPLMGGRPSTGFTDSDGRFELWYTRDLSGVVPGRHAVTLDWYPTSDAEKPTEAIAAAIKLHGSGGKPLEVEVDASTPQINLAIE